MQEVRMGGALKNDLWVTDAEEKADPKILPELPGFNLLIRPVSVKSETKGGILLPNSTKEDMACYGKHAGTKLYYKGVRLILLFDDQIMMKVEDPRDLDLSINLSKFSS